MSSVISKTKRMKVMEKTNFRCAYCGVELPENYHAVEHVIPKCKGGSNNIDNLLPTCLHCNSSKYKNSLSRFRYMLSCKKIGMEPFSEKVIQNYREHGYELPMPPLIDFYIEKITGKKLGE